MGDLIHIAFGFDNNYAMPCGVAMLSVCINTPGPVCFHTIITEDVTEESRKRLEDIASSNGKKIIFYSPDTTQLNGLPEFIHITKGTYLRFLIPSLLSSEIHKVLYLDVDILAIKSLRPLWETDLGSDIPVAMTIDRLTSSLEVHGPSGVPMSREYFNAGVMLMNLDCWRNEGLGKICLENIHEHQYPLMDQDAINSVMGTRVKRVHLRYNAQIAFLKKELDSRFIDVDRYKEEIDETKCDPVIVHYSESTKPWNFGYKWSEEWLKYKALSPWKDTPLLHRIANGQHKIILSGVKKMDVEYVDSISLPLLTIVSRLGQRHPRIHSLLRKVLWTYVKRKNLIGDITETI